MDVPRTRRLKPLMRLLRHQEDFLIWATEGDLDFVFVFHCDYPNLSYVYVKEIVERPFLSMHRKIKTREVQLSSQAYDRAYLFTSARVGTNVKRLELPTC